MFVIAKAVKEREYLYNYRTAHKVSAASAEKILAVLNEYKFRLKDGEVWHIYDVCRYDSAYDVAQYQKFTIRKGIVKEVMA